MLSYFFEPQTSLGDIPINWITLLAIAAAGLGVYLILTSRASQKRFSLIRSLGIAIVIVGTLAALPLTDLTIKGGIFFAFCGLAVVGCVAFLSSRQPVYAACNFAIVVLAVCGIFMLLSAPYLAAATIIIYAGATIIIFLFVLMFSQQAQLQIHETSLNSPGLAVMVGTSLLCLIAISGFTLTPPGVLSAPSDRLMAEGQIRSQHNVSDKASSPDTPTDNLPITGQGHETSVASLGRVLFTEYLWLIEIVGSLLTVAVIGAIVIAEGDDDETPNLQSTRAKS